MGNAFKKIGDWLLNWFVAFLIIILPVAFYFQFVITKPDQVKQVVRDSGVYNKLVPAIINQTVSEMKSTAPNELPLNDPKIQEIFVSSIDAQSTQTYAETAIDSIYAWLSSPSDNISGTIDYSKSRQTIIEQLVGYAGKRAESLPQCTPAQSRAVATEFNAFNTPCRPIGLDAKALAEQLNKELSRSDTPLAKDKFEFTNSGFGGIGEKSDKYKSYYRLASNAFWIVLAIFVLVFAGLIYRYRNKKLRAIYVTSLKNAIGLAIIATFAIVLYSKSPSNAIMEQNPIGKDVVMPLGYAFVAKLAYIQYAFAVGLLVIAVAGWLIEKRFAKKPSAQPTAPKPDDQAPTQDPAPHETGSSDQKESNEHEHEEHPPQQL